MSSATATIDTTLTPISIETEELSKFRRQDAAIAKLAEKYLPLTIDGVNDKQGFKAVHDARMVVKKTRVAVEQTRKELKADALRYGQTVDAEARRLTALLEPIESHLQAEEDAVEQAKQKIKQAAEDARRMALKMRINALTNCGYLCDDPVAIGDMTDQQFETILAAARLDSIERDRIATIEKERLAVESEVRRIEAEKLAAERERLEKIEMAQLVEARRLRAERIKIEQQEAEQKRAVELEAAKQQAAERARVETEQRLAAQVAKEKADADAKEAARLKAEAERPHRERLLEVARKVESILVPNGPCFKEVRNVLGKAARAIEGIANGPLA